MTKNKWQFGAITYKKATVEGLDWLPPEHKEQLHQLFEHGELTETLNLGISSDEAMALSFINDEGVESNVTMQVVTFGKFTKLEVAQSDSIPFFARILHLEKKGETIFERTLAIDNKEIIVDREEPTDTEFVGSANIHEFLKQATVKKGSPEEISAKAWYSKVPCVANGCCGFNEPAWNGGPLIPVIYKWCGANCGSGTPVNALDTCCRTHDYCYNSFSKYPDRCACDKNLINCSSKVSGNSSLLVRTAFKLKMSYQKC